MGLLLSLDEKRALNTFWEFYEPRRASIVQRTRASLAEVPEWRDVLQQIDPRDDERSYRLQVAAILGDCWEPFLESLRIQGEHYATAGMSYSACLELLSKYREIIRDDLRAFLRADPDHNAASMFEIARGLNRFVDVIAAEIGEAYVAAKERVIASAKEHYRAMFEQAPQPMWMFDRETLRFLAVNEAAVRHYGYSRDEFLAMTIEDIRSADDAQKLRASIGVGLTIDSETWRHRKKDGAEIIVEIRANDFVSDGKNVRLVQAADVTERTRAQQALRQTEEQLRQAQKMEAIGRLAGGVAHDFNNILTVVQSYACLLQEAIDPADSRHADAAEIGRAADRATAVTRQLLALSRHSIVSPRSVDVDEIITGFQPMLRRLLGEAVTIGIHKGSVPSVMIDPGQLEQVLLNLAVNARDAMSAGGRFTIETRVRHLDAEDAALQGVQPGEFVEIAVTDTGHGMDAETKQHIFEPFFSTKEAGKGTGLGLSIVHGIIAQSGGTISVYSELGKGTTFRVQLPVSDKPTTPAETVRVVSPRTLPPLRILVVDDQPSVRAVACRVLKDAGCELVEASTAQEAQRICVEDTGRIDLALLDVVLPDGGGEGLIRVLRELRPTMKFVQMSGYPVGALGSNVGAELLPKPFSPSELRAAIATAAGQISTASASDVVREPGADKRRALLAEDDVGLRKAIAKMLARAGFDVVQIDSGFKAISALERETFDVVVSDVQMPDGGGLDLLRAIRRVDLDVPVILMTGHPTVDGAAAAVEYGAFRYLTKPLDRAELLKTVEHAARAHALARLRREAFSVSGMHAGVTDRAGLEVRFEQAIDGMWMAFQPIVEARTGVLYGVEALVRTREASMPNPGVLLDAATQLERLPAIGRRIRALSAAQIANHSANVALFVNLHPADLRDADLIDPNSRLAAIANRVVLEITERASLEPCAELSDRLATLRQLGFRIAVDDIGAGYSGLTSFTELTPEIVKIDMSLVRDVHLSALKQRTIGALCRLCHEVGTLVVGEGVETNDERDVLVGLGCDLLQGYLIGRPKAELP